ncbi:hypothetical protein KKF05_02625 [Patescibacteria group bacterium]|nr:hypothetical protein [Patescibacteria group bacterium]MBU1028643.1 hypothetical protein [Patescibacteria group bacterium]MBU1916372.1 hypothetical protein [Patescibacteria group bacterium]
MSVDSDHLGRKLRVAFTNALQTMLKHWQETDGKDGQTYQSCLTAFWGFCEQVARQQDLAYPLAANIIAEKLLVTGVPRELRSVILTALACWPFESHGSRGAVLSGRHVAHFGRVLNRTAEHCACYYTEWFVDMGNGIPLVRNDSESVGDYHDWLLAPQSTRMMRGILFASKLQTGRLDLFWTLAAADERFPERIFTDPGDYERRSCYMTPTQMAQLATFFAYAPEEAVRRFAAAFHQQVMSMQLIIYAGILLSGGVAAEVAVCDPEASNVLQLFSGVMVNTKFLTQRDIRYHKEIEVTADKRQALLCTIRALIQDAGRRQLVREIFVGDEGGE